MERCLSADREVWIPWVVLLGFLRLTTHTRILTAPLSVEAACRIVQSWLERPQVSILNPGEKHGEILFRLLKSSGAGGNLTTDAHLAALALEHQVELLTTDSDFRRFENLRWRNPLEE